MNETIYGAMLRRRTLLTTLMAAPFAACGARKKNEAMNMRTSKAKAGDGVTIRYAVIGEGKPLVLLHGFSDQIDSWTEFGYVDALASAGRRLVLIDQRGHGGTSAPHDIDAYAPARRAGDIAAVLDEIGAERADIFGYSMGGWTALNVARFHAGRVDRLIVGGCHPFGQNMAFYREAVAGDIGKWIGIVEQLGGPMPARWKERVRNTDIIALRAAVAEDRPDISNAFSGFERPALFFSGGDDPLHDAVARCAEFFPDARFAEIEGCNHMTAFLRADLVALRLNAFLAERAPT
ncbi:alpha/beta fold hydrolase [Hyphococcus luteus]|uniref:AB hydrolase-1 domain-containing protein n=1 Tax=Hyphococcus luteus TaxID=2058213 RepID=A0A2S7K7B2_9PROT|nr:alpha/beta hydrolase [Marinicaulis flavus]PQA88382.1 hypothetical protein CW354_08780 [Marinicaulis flavus]